MKIMFEPNRLSKSNLSEAYEKVVEIKSRKIKANEKESIFKLNNIKKTGDNSK